MFKIVQYNIHTRIEVFDSYTPKRNRETRTQAMPYFENKANAVAVEYTSWNCMQTVGTKLPSTGSVGPPQTAGDSPN
jgi:hypothetical protein